MINLYKLCARPSSRNGKYSNGVAGGGYPGIQNMAYSPAYSNGVSSLHSKVVALIVPHCRVRTAQYSAAYSDDIVNLNVFSI